MSEKITNSDAQIALAEYAEAGTQCRWYEQLTRIVLMAFSAMVAAILAYVASKNASVLGSIAVSLFGVLVSLVLLGSHIRNNAYYRGYMQRIHVIEARLGISLYTDGLEVHRQLRVPSNKLAFAFIYSVAAMMFLVSAIYNICLLK